MMPKYDWNAGDIYGQLMLTGKSFVVTGEPRKVEAICSCGKIGYYGFNKLKDGHTKSCGCTKSIIVGLSHLKHGFAINGRDHPIYRAYLAIKNRCYNQNGRAKKWYKDKGVVMCDEWLSDFNNFKKWSLENGWQQGLSIDRYPNTNGNYEPINCRWATQIQQSRNRDCVINITAFGETKCLEEWSQDARCSVTSNTIKSRIKRGWEVELAITKESATSKMKQA